MRAFTLGLLAGAGIACAAMGWYVWREAIDLARRW